MNMRRNLLLSLILVLIVSGSGVMALEPEYDPTILPQEDMPYFRKKICADILLDNAPAVKFEQEQDDDVTVIHNEDGSIVIVIDDEEEGRSNAMPQVIDLTSDDVDTKDLIDEAIIMSDYEDDESDEKKVIVLD